jgi:hypothetical protein
MKKIHWILLLAALVRIGLLCYNLWFNPQFAIQQDNYATFTEAWRNGTLASGGVSHFDTRLFPGYPFLILVLSWIVPLSDVVIGVGISLGMSILAVYLFWLWTKDELASLIFALFPPVWVQSAVKVATEPLSVALMLGSVLSWQKKYFFWAGLLLGYACVIRNIAVFLASVLSWLLLQKKDWRSLVKFSVGMSISLIGLLIFNGYTYGWNQLLYQIGVYNAELDTGVGVVQLIKDILRTIDWGQYRILVSGLVYVLVAVGGWWGLFKQRSQNQLNLIAFYWATGSLLFLMTLSMPTFLEDFGRYAIPIAPALTLGWLELIRKKLKS